MEYEKKHQKTLDTAIEILREKIPGLVAIIVFGSFGTEYERKESDLDLAILTEEPANSLDPVQLWNLAQELARTINSDIELIDLRQASTVFCFQVLSTGTPIYCANDVILARFDTMIMSMYQRLQEERKDILNDYQKGHFYG